MDVTMLRPGPVPATDDRCVHGLTVPTFGTRKPRVPTSCLALSPTECKKSWSARRGLRSRRLYRKGRRATTGTRVALLPGAARRAVRAADLDLRHRGGRLRRVVTRVVVLVTGVAAAGEEQD